MTKDLKNNINVRISDSQKTTWEKFMIENHFTNLSSLVRWCCEEIIERGVTIRQKTNGDNNVKQQIKEIDTKYDELAKQNMEIMKLIASKTVSSQKSEKIRDYQKLVILNMLKEQPRDEEEIGNILEMDEAEVLSVLNGLLEISKIRKNKQEKYEVII